MVGTALALGRRVLALLLVAAVGGFELESRLEEPGASDVLFDVPLRDRDSLLLFPSRSNAIRVVARGSLSVGDRLSRRFGWRLLFGLVVELEAWLTPTPQIGRPKIEQKRLRRCIELTASSALGTRERLAVLGCGA